MRGSIGILLIAAFIAVGCTGPTELSNADVEAKKKEFSQQNLENSMKGPEADQLKKDEADRAAERER